MKRNSFVFLCLRFYFIFDFTKEFNFVLFNLFTKTILEIGFFNIFQLCVNFMKGMGDNAPQRLVYKRLIEMNIPIDEYGQVSYKPELEKTMVFISYFLENFKKYLIFTKSSNEFGKFSNFPAFL